MLSRGSFARGVLRRRMTHVCFPGVVSCRVFPTACEAYARGKVYWTFRAELVMHATLGLRLRGDPRASGSVCRPSKTTLLEPE